MKPDILKVGVLASGRGSNLQAIIDASEKGDIDTVVAVVLSDKSDAYALVRADKHGIPNVHVNPNDFSNKEEYELAIAVKLREYDVSLVLLAGYMRVVTKVLINAFNGDIMNIHPALLPSFIGLHAQRQAIEYGVRFSGCTVHFVTENVDGGPIINQAVVPVYADDTEDSLSARILEKEHIIYPEAVQLFAEGRLKREGRRVVIV
ncbi:MAG: phosphoribosylglycinamide formyltransferase [Nitrospira sp.]|nr:phosphoribosylglycinamide formyltransferase [Nitrospira sp.]